MKQKIRNILIYTFFFSGIPYLRFLFLRKKGPVVRVLALHDVKESEKVDFVRFLDFLDRKFNVISPRDFQEKRFDTKKINILFTFDDGYESWETIVTPELKRKGWGAYFFISSGFVQTYGNEEAEKEFCREQLLISHRKPISWDGLKKITVNKKNVVGGHTVNHVSLKELSPEQQYKEIVECKNTIESILKNGTNTFAYPFGVPGIDYDVCTMEQVKQAGYTEAFTTKISFVENKLGNFLLSRTCIESATPSFLMYMLILGVYDILKKLQYMFWK
ncbi:MAG: polysaccharide deacetylase family protein [Candidatus Pacebacteria bacterium]|nr:polysaccharide deacetylase family protein [Candidatus Paceibacterota bacterium]